jgi:predicted amidohydrolase YtcJ
LLVIFMRLGDIGETAVDGGFTGPTAEAITIDQAIRGYTYMVAWLSFEERTKGGIEPGKFADVIVLDIDPLLISPEKLLTMKVDETYLDGKRVYDRLAR